MSASARAVLVGLLAGLWASPAWALFEISADPRKGGRDLRFDASRVSSGVPEEELTLTVESDQAVPYRVYVTYLSPLVNDQGRTLPAGALYVFSPTNALGDLRLKLETPLSLGQTIVYTSNSAGDSDRMTLVFHVELPQDLPGGLYRTSLSFTLEPVTPVAGLTPRTVTLDVRVEAKPAFRWVVSGEKGGEKLDLGHFSQKGMASPGVLKFQIESNVGQSYRIFQELRGPLVSEAGAALPEDALAFSVEGVSDGRGASGTLSSAPSLLYESADGGGGAEFRAVYQVNTSVPVPAGRFSGILLLRVDSSSPYAMGQTIQLPVVYEVEPIFNLHIDIPGGFGLQFGNLRSGEEAPEKRVILTVQSNLGKPYQVSQILSRKMSTPEGSVLPDESFRYTIKKTDTGTVGTVALRPVPPGESPLFLSDAQGTPEVIECSYFLSVPLEAKSGPYGTEIKYSITTL